MLRGVSVQLKFTCSTASFKNHQHPNQTHNVRTVENATKTLDECEILTKDDHRTIKLKLHIEHKIRVPILPTPYTD